MVKTVDMVHPGIKFLSICGHVKPRGQLSISKMQRWDRHKIDILFQKRETGKKKRPCIPNKSKPQQGKSP